MLGLPLVAAIIPFVVKGRTQLWGWTTIVFSFVALLISTVLAVGLGSERVLIANAPWIYLDALSIYFILLVNLVVFVASWFINGFLMHKQQNNTRHNPRQFHFFFNLFHLTMLAVPMVRNLVFLWIAVELTTVFSTILVGYRGDRKALEAAWKYIIITTTGIIFALLGTLFLANAIQPDLLQSATDPLDWSWLATPNIAGKLDQTFVKLSFLFVLVGYGTKAGFAPMHTWLPDGHGEAPFPVSALLSGVLLKSALYALLRFYTITKLALAQSGTNFLPASWLIVGLFSLGLATPFILKENRFKRILAYHSLEHMGIIAFGVGIGSSLALFGVLLHALNHALTKALMFLTYGHVRQIYATQSPNGQISDEDVKGVLSSLPYSGVLLMLGGLALVGVPPFNIFMSEFIILWAALAKPFTWMSLFAVSAFLITVTIIFAGLVRHLSRVILGKPPFALMLESKISLAPLLLLIGVILIFGVVIPTVPIDFSQLLNQSVNIIMEGSVVLQK